MIHFYSDPTNSIKIATTLDNGDVARKMAMEKCIFLIPAHIVANLVMARLKEKADYIIPTGIYILEIGEMINHMDLVNI